MKRSMGPSMGKGLGLPPWALPSKTLHLVRYLEALGTCPLRFLWRFCYIEMTDKTTGNRLHPFPGGWGGAESPNPLVLPWSFNVQSYPTAT
jgi:hypothetical protein